MQREVPRELYLLLSGNRERAPSIPLPLKALHGCSFFWLIFFVGGWRGHVRRREAYIR